MNKQEIKDKIAKMKCEIKNLKKEINKQEEPKRRWKPEFREEYYFINSGGLIIRRVWTNDIDDNRRYAIGNIYRTEEEAKFAVEQLKILAELKEYADDNKEWDDNTKHWCISYDTDIRSIDNDGCFYSVINTPFNIYFSSKEQAQKAIDAIGEERLKKYYFCVEE